MLRSSVQVSKQVVLAAAKCSTPAGAGSQAWRSSDPLVARLNKLSIINCSATRVNSASSSVMSVSAVKKQPYILPTLDSKRVQKISILDPLLSRGEYILPTSAKIVHEKVSPSLNNVEIKEAPTTINNAIKKEGAQRNEFGRIVRRYPNLMISRHKMMKKHQLKKLRKRMYYTWKKEAEIKNRKKEKKMLAYEDSWRKLAGEFDAEKFVTERIDLAKKGGWGVNIFERR